MHIETPHIIPNPSSVAGHIETLMHTVPNSSSGAGHSVIEGAGDTEPNKNVGNRQERSLIHRARDRQP